MNAKSIAKEVKFILVNTYNKTVFKVTSTGYCVVVTWAGGPTAYEVGQKVSYLGDVKLHRA